jgi:IPT/TIG domain/Kelch motif/Galactose oxidase, central domain
MKRKQCILAIFVIFIWSSLAGCGGGGTGSELGPMPAPNAVPAVASVTPNSVAAGAPDTTVTISGSGFISSSTANLNGQPLRTTFVSGTQLSAVIPAASLSAGAINNVTVTNPPPGGGTSGGAVVFTVNNPSPTITQVTPNSIPSGTAAILIVTGTNFVPTSSVTLDGQGLQTSFVSSTKLQGSVPASPAIPAGSHTVAVVNSSPGGGTSGTSVLAVHLTIKVFQTAALWAPNSTNDVWARVSGGVKGTITWSIQEGSAGGQLIVNDVFDSSLNVRKMGYIAPTVPGTYHVIATSDDDPTQQAQAVVTVAATAEIFKKTGNLTTDHQIDFSATRLADGRVLIAGGGNGVALVSAAELYDPGTGTFIATGSMTQARMQQTATLLHSGKVLVCGGIDSSGNALSSCELYDPSTGIFTLAASMSGQRLNHTATLLADGTVFISGGDRLHQGRGTCELYDPVANTFKSTADLTAPRFVHTATLLNNGKLLITGGFNPIIGADLASAEIYDIAANTSTPTGSMSLSRRFHNAVLLSTGKVLVTPGEDLLSADMLEIYDPVSGKFSQAQLHIGRNDGTAIVLSDGRVLLAGGAFLSEVLFSAEVFDPITQSLVFTDNAAVDHFLGRSVLLTNGTILIVGSDFSPIHADIYTVGP